MTNKSLQIIVVVIATALGAALFFGRTIPESTKALAVESETSDNTEGQDIDAQIDEAIALTQKEAPMKGILKLREIADQNPDNIRVYMELGAMSLQTGQNEKALKRFSHVIEIDSSFLEAHFMMAASHLAVEDTAKALESMNYVTNNAEDNSELMTQGNNFIQQLLK